ncbi:MAG: OmpA family protein [Bacteroidales bacterium]|nr:OmpA family protein [Bacteroidales bacterium]
MKFRTIAVACIALMSGVAAFGQNNVEYYKTNWFAGIGGGINVGFDGQKYENRENSHSGAGLAVDVYAGKWLNDWGGFRVGWQGLTVSEQYTDFGEKNFNYVHADALLRAHKNIIPYVHVGYVHIDKSNVAGGVGLMTPFMVTDKISIVPDVRYAVMGNHAYAEGKRRPASNLAITVGLAFNLGGKLHVKKEYVDREVIKYVDRPYKVTDTVYVEVPDLQPMEDEINEFLKNVTLFEFDSFKITNEAQVGLDKVVDWMNKYPSVRAHVDGHTDNIGTEAYNQNLSEKRAKAIVDYLVEKGIAASRLSYEGHGFSQPVAGNDTAEGRQQNRRIEITFSNPHENRK